MSVFWSIQIPVVSLVWMSSMVTEKALPWVSASHFPLKSGICIHTSADDSHSDSKLHFFFFGEIGFFGLFDIQWIYLLIRDIVSDNQSFFKRFPVSPKNLPWHWTSSMIIFVYAIIGNKETRGAFKYGFDWLNKSIISLVFCLVCRM